MAPIAGLNIIVLMMKSLNHDLTSRINTRNDAKQILSMRSIFLANQQSQVYNAMSGVNSEGTAAEKSRYKNLLDQANRYTAQIKIIEMKEKQIDQEIQRLQTQLKIAEQREQAAEKMLEQNIQKSFNYGTR